MYIGQTRINKLKLMQLKYWLSWIFLTAVLCRHLTSRWPCINCYFNTIYTFRHYIADSVTITFSIIEKQHFSSGLCRSYHKHGLDLKTDHCGILEYAAPQSRHGLVSDSVLKKQISSTVILIFFHIVNNENVKPRNDPGYRFDLKMLLSYANCNLYIRRISYINYLRTGN